MENDDVHADDTGAAICGHLYPEGDDVCVLCGGVRDADADQDDTDD